MGLKELRVATAAVVVTVFVGILVGVDFLKRAPIGQTTSRPHPHLSLGSTHPRHPDKLIWPPSWG